MSYDPAVADITDQLLKRSQDAIGQLELWIQKQENDLYQDDISNNNNNNNNNIEIAKTEQQKYVKQLKSLQRRSLYLKHNIHPNNNSNNSNQFGETNSKTISITNNDDIKYMENLVFEFKDLTLKLNELAQTRKSVNLKSTTQSDNRSNSSSSSSDDSLELKPLRILSRPNIRNSALFPKTATSTITTTTTTTTTPKETVLESFSQSSSLSSPNSNKISDYSIIESTPKRKTFNLGSVPNSPIKYSNKKNHDSTHKLRMAKSYHDGLNKDKDKDRDKEKVQTNNPFNKNNRLSLALFQNMKNINTSVIHSDDDGDIEYDSDNEDDEEEEQDELDQDTVLLPYDNGYGNKKYLKTPILTPTIYKFPPLRRSNSHDSIFSQRSIRKPLRFYQFVTNTATSTSTTSRSVSTNDSINSNVISQPIFVKPSSSSTTMGTNSKTLLANIINSKASHSSIPTNKTVSYHQHNNIHSTTSSTTTSNYFANWNIFGKKTISNIISETGVCNPRTGTSRIKNDRRRPSNASSVVVTAVVGHNKGKTKKLSPSKKPIMDLDIRQHDLQDALNTELLL